MGKQKEKQAVRIYNFREDLKGAEGVFEPAMIISFTLTLAPKAVASFARFSKSVPPTAGIRVLGEHGICDVEPGVQRGSIWPPVSCLLMVTADSVEV